MRSMTTPRQTYSVYGIEMNDLERAKEKLEAVFAVRFQPHESEYLGEYFLFKGANAEQMKLQRNTYPEDGDPAEPDFNPKGLLLRVDGLVEGTPRFLEVERKIRESLPMMKMLSRETS
jgi:hypothetical protein